MLKKYAALFIAVISATVLITNNRSEIRPVHAAAGNELIVYDDALRNNFIYSEWQNPAGTKCATLNYTQDKFSGTSSVAVNANDWCAAIFYTDNQPPRPILTDNWDALEFDVKFQTPLLPTLRLSLMQNAWTPFGTEVSLKDTLGITPSSQWQHIRIPMAKFELPSGTDLAGFFIHDREVNVVGRGNALIDNFKLIKDADNTPPTITSVKTLDLSHLDVTFSEKVESVSATTLSNYGLTSSTDPNYSSNQLPTGATLAPTAKDVILTLPKALVDKSAYTLAVANVKDIVSPPNTMPSITSNFTASYNPATVTIDANANKHAINPQVYGLAFADQSTLSDLNVPYNRAGGNAQSTYNWQTDYTNRASDWYFETLAEGNGSQSNATDSFVSSTKAGGAEPSITVPVMDWIAKGTRSASFSAAKYGAQDDCDWSYYPDACNGIKNGSPIAGNNPSDAYVANSTNIQKSWVQYLIGKFGGANGNGVKNYILGNEWGLWNDTHRDIHPNGVTMDETRDRMTNYAKAIKEADPNAIVQGPEEWGWTNYFYSGADTAYADKNGWDASKFPDRNAHGGMDYQPWLLQQMKNAETANGKRLLDVFTLHYYPQGGEPLNEDVSTAKQLLRNRSTRSLWDSNYTDESWIGDKVQLIPRMKGWVNANYPGTKIGITEYNWGAESHINGATTIADVWGIFGREGLDLANYWTSPATNSPVYNAMKLYRNYDGKKGAFGETSVSTAISGPVDTANPECVASTTNCLTAFSATRSSDGALTIMVVNKDLSSSAPLALKLNNFSGNGSAQAWQLTSANKITRLTDIAFTGSTVNAFVPAQSVTLFVVAPQTATPQATITLNKSVDKASAVSGDTLLYTVTATNTSTVTASNVTITDAIPTGTTYVANSATSTPAGTVNVAGGNLTCTIPSLAGGANLVIKFNVKVN